MVKKSVGGRSRMIYNWKKWLKSKRFTLKKGKDFNCLPHSLAQQCRNAAYRYGYKVSINIYEDSIEVFSRKEDI